MARSGVAELQALSKDIGARAAAVRAEPDWAALNRLEESASAVQRAWSGSSIGRHARVYYAGLAVPPPGAHFSQSWGFIPFGDTRGDWREYRHEDVLEEILRRAGDPDMGPLERSAADLRKEFESARGRVQSIVTIELERKADAYLESLMKQVGALEPLSVSKALSVQLPTGMLMSRDTEALAQGPQSAPHQDVFARIVALRSSVSVAEDLAKLATQAADHLERRSETARPSGASAGKRVFIGHGGSPEWRKLKDFVTDRLKLDWDEFNRTPTAGLATKERLQQMLDSAGFALLVLTAEDELADGQLVARQNVVHEAGLFQGRLGWEKAIILLEDGCAEFSNILGLGQIRFPKDRIEAIFEEIRAVLEREGLL